MYLYQFVTEKGSELLTLEQAKARYEVTCYNFNKSNRKELQGQPKFLNFLGPMYNGINQNGNIIIRYETKKVYNMLSV